MTKDYFLVSKIANLIKYLKKLTISVVTFPSRNRFKKKLHYHLKHVSATMYL